MKARPVLDAATSAAWRGSRPRWRSSTNLKRISDVNSVHTAITSGPPTAVIGLRVRSNAKATSDASPTAISTGTSDRSDRTTLRSRNERKMNTKPIARYVSSTRFASRLRSKPTPTTARPDGVREMPAGTEMSSWMCSTSTACRSSEPGPTRNAMLNALPSSLTVDTLMSSGATS